MRVHHVVNSIVHYTLYFKSLPGETCAQLTGIPVAGILELKMAYKEKLATRPQHLHQHALSPFSCLLFILLFL